MCNTCGCKSAEEGRVRTMSGKPHTPRKLRKDQNIKPEEARMRKQMKAEEYFDCGCVYEEMAEGAMCESCGHTTCIDCSENINTTDADYRNWRCYEGYGCNKGAESFEAQSDRGFFAEDLKMESYCGRCDKRTEISKIPWGATFCVCGRGKSIIVDGYELGTANRTPQYIEDFLRSRGMRDYGAEGFEAESTPFAEGRMAARTMFTPERTPEDYYSGLDTEYMIAYDISPDELMKEVESNRTRYLQFLAGWDDGWNYSSLVVNNVIEDEDDFPYDYLYEDLDMTTDYEFAGEYYHYKDRKGIDFPDVFDEYLPDFPETLRGVATIIGVGAFAWLGMLAIQKIKRE